MKIRPWVRDVAGLVLITALVVTAFVTGRQVDSLTADVQTNKDSVGKVEEILADVCKVAPDPSLVKAGRAAECKLAEQGKIEETVPVVTPKVRYQQVSRAQIEDVVDSYLDNRLRELPEQYRTELRASVVNYLRANPPKNGKDGKSAPPPTAAQIAPVVAAYVSANPPPAGKDGKPGADGTPGTDGDDGVSVTGAALDGCDLVFSFSNDTTVRVGPICGPAGAEGKQGETGKQGEQGRGLVSQNCVAGDDIDQDGDGVVASTDWLMTYDKPDADGRTSQREDGPCRVSTSTPEPSAPVSQPVTLPGQGGP